MKAAGQAPYKVGLFEADIGLMISLWRYGSIHLCLRLNLLASTFASSFDRPRASGGWPRKGCASKKDEELLMEEAEERSDD
jgi:hypothetical protein